ncbi:helix-turn-helix domain-containing protein [Bacteroidota bacterium]
MRQELLSTGQAAKLCSVTPDTILKWIKKNKIEAVKTAGGHYRIVLEKLKQYMVESLEYAEKEPIQINYCWEYHSQNEDVNESCRECIIFRSKAEKCYLIAGMGKDAGHAQLFCTNSCYECDFFHFVNKSPNNVLIITENDELKKQLKFDIQNNFTLKFSCCGYETSSIIQEFHPDYIILDESLVNSNPDEICKHLLNDPRVHGSQIVLAITKKRTENQLPEGVCASIGIPFYASDMEECIHNLQNSFYGSQPILIHTDK